MSVLLRCLSVLVLLSVAACGGGGGNKGSSGFGGGADGAAPTITVVLSTSTVTASAPATVTATLVNASNVPMPGQVITFESIGGLGSFSSTTALTNASGVATVTLQPRAATTTGADTVTASADISGVVVTASAGFNVSRPAGSGSTSATW